MTSYPQTPKNKQPHLHNSTFPMSLTTSTFPPNTLSLASVFLLVSHTPLINAFMMIFISNMSLFVKKSAVAILKLHNVLFSNFLFSSCFLIVYLS